MSTNPSCIRRLRGGGDAAGRRRGDGRRGVMTSVDSPVPKRSGPRSLGALAGAAAGCRRGMRGLRHHLRTGAAHAVGEPERRRHRRHLADRRGLYRRTGRWARWWSSRCWRTRPSHSSPSRRCWASSVGCPRRRCTWCSRSSTSRRLDVGAGGEHRPDRRAGRCRGAAADDAAAARRVGRVRPTPAAPWPTSTRPTTSAR